MWLSWLDIVLQNRKSLVQFLVRALAWVVGSVPRAHMRCNQSMFLTHINVSLHLFLSPSLPLSLK